MNLKCPYCGGGIEVTEYMYLNGDEYSRIECDNYSKCGAEWDAYGNHNRGGLKSDG